MKYSIFSLFLVVAAISTTPAMASFSPPTCASPNTVTGTLGAATYSAGLAGCLTVGTVANDPGNGLWTASTKTTNFQTGGLEIAWSITKDPSLTGDWDYEYYITNATQPIANLDIGLSSKCTTATTAVTQLNAGVNNCIFDLQEKLIDSSGNKLPTEQVTCGSNQECGDTTPSNFSTLASIETPTQGLTGTHVINPAQPWDTEQLFIPSGTNQDSLVVNFTSSYAPSWENIYTRDDSSAWNNATLTNTGGITQSGETGFMIAAPGVPEPGYYGALAVGLGLLFLAMRFRRNLSATK